MDKINVLIIAQTATPEAIQIISTADPRICVTTIPYLEPLHRRTMRREGRGSELEKLPMSPELTNALAEADVIYASDCPSNTPQLAPKLKWVQRAGAGVEHLGPGGGTGLWESDLSITTLGGFNSRAIAEFVLGLMLSHVKNFPLFLQAQEERKWERATGATTLHGKTAGIIGFGRIGQETARLCKAMGMRVVANRRTPGPELPTNVDRLLGPDDVNAVLAEGDFIILCLPVTTDTENIISKAEFQLMKPQSMLINVGRGALVDEKALIAALESGEIAAAGLDTVAVEPLPPESPLWDAPNVIITPHSAASIREYAVEAAKEFANNLKRFATGKPLLNMVDRNKGY